MQWLKLIAIFSSPVGSFHADIFHCKTVHKKINIYYKFKHVFENWNRI